MTLQEAIKYVKEASLSEEISPDDNMILDCAVRVFISNNISESKRENIKAIHNQPGQSQGKISKSDLPPFTSSQKVDNSPSSPDNSPPTKGQIKFLELNKLEIPKTKKVAWQIINSFKNEQGGY